MAAKLDGLAGVVLLTRPAGHARRSGRVHVVDVELPGKQLLERREGGGGRRTRGEGPHQGDARAARVEAQRVSADDPLADAAVAPLVDGAEAIDEEIVAEIVEARALDMVVVDGAHDGRRLAAGVAVAAGRVVDEGHLHRGSVGIGPTQRLIGPPVGSAHDCRLAGRGARHVRMPQPAEGGGHLPDDVESPIGEGSLAEAVHEGEFEALDRAIRDELDVAGLSDPAGLGDQAAGAHITRRTLQREHHPLGPHLSVEAGTDTNLCVLVLAVGASAHGPHEIEVHAGVEDDGIGNHVGIRMCG